MEKQMQWIKELLSRITLRGDREKTHMYMIAGLGNPGKDYENTRHNMGFRVIDLLAEKYNIDVSTGKFRALIGKGAIEGQKVLLMKPLTYMNLSGECIRPFADYFKVDTKTELIVISDDIDLDVGALRIRPKGSAGGHNGLKSIIAHLGHDEFSRVRVGVGHKPPKMDLADYVLGHFAGDDARLIELSIENAAEAVKEIIENGTDSAMNKFNGKKAEL